MQAPHTAARTTLVSRIVTSLALVSALGACGYKGPLYLPPPPEAPDASLTAPPTQQQTPGAQADEAAQAQPVAPEPATTQPLRPGAGQ